MASTSRSESRGTEGRISRYTPLRERLMAQVSPEPMSGCWLWIGPVNVGGYGKIGKGGASRLAHRVSYELLRGPIPEGMEMDHLCRVRCCVNPDHLEPVTHQENGRRGISGKTVAARMAALTHCKNGHEFTAENTRTSTHPDGGVRRNCRACRVQIVARYRKRYGRQGTATNPRRPS
jgi:hypothetical protein